MCPAERNNAESIIGRVAAICDACGPGGDVLGISEIARRTGLAKSTVASDNACMACYLASTNHRRSRAGISMLMVEQLWAGANSCPC